MTSKCIMFVMTPYRIKTPVTCKDTVRLEVSVNNILGMKIAAQKKYKKETIYYNSIQ